MKVKIKDIAYSFPKSSETNDVLKKENPNWDMDKITEKTGIKKRFIAFWATILCKFSYTMPLISNIATTSINILMMIVGVL